jgi:hypothetical protein
VEALPRLLVPRFAHALALAETQGGFWSAVPPVRLHDVVTGGNPRQMTELRVAATDHDLRVLFTVVDDYVWATHTQRKAPLYNEEVVEVFLDPVGDLGAYFEIELNPLGAVLDLLIRRNMRGLLKDFRWKCEGLETRVARNDDGWTAELAIPWSGLVTERPTAGTRWRANFTRIDRPQGQPRELSAWSQTGQPLFHVPERFGVLEFV